MRINRTESIRLEILTQCYGYRPNSRTAAAIVSLARREGDVRDVIEREVETEIAYLVGKTWLEEEPFELSQGVKRWKITAAGIDYLEKQGWI